MGSAFYLSRFQASAYPFLMLKQTRKEAGWIGCLLRVVYCPGGITLLYLMESLRSVLPKVSWYLTTRKDEMHMSPFDYQV